MSKKDYIIQILEKLEPYWELITDLIQVVKSGACSEEDMDTIIEIVERHIQEIDNQELKEKFMKAHELLVKIKQQEAEDRKKEELDINELLIQISQL